MATYTTNVQADFSQAVGFFFAGPASVISLTSSQMILKTPSGFTQIYEGSFFYSYSGGHQVFNWNEKSSVTAIKSYDIDGTYAAGAVGLSVIGDIVKSYADLNDGNGLKSYVFRGNDAISGSSHGDVLWGYAGNDMIEGKGGNDIIDGGEGENTIVYSWKRSEYKLTINNNGSWNISDYITGRDGTDTITNFKYIQFSDTVINSTFSDTIAPFGIHSIPSSEKTDVSITENISYTFNESIQRGTGNIVLKTSAGTTVETFDAATSNHLSISGATLTIDPTNTLNNNTNFYVDFAPGTINDLAGNTFPGTTSFNFTTIPMGQILHGTNRNDTLTGGGGDDSFSGFKGDDIFNGGDGVDAIILSGLPSQYHLNGNTLTGFEGTDTLSSIEQFRFGNLYVSNLPASALIDPDGAGPADSPAKDLLQGISDLYVAYFNRAPDVDGLMYWFREVMNGSTWTLPTIAQSFTDQAEYRATYPPGLSNREFISAIYQNLFDRAPDAAGWDYWENDLNHGVPRDVFIYSIIQGAYAPSGSATDKSLLNNKHDVSLYYSGQLATSAEGFDTSIAQVSNRVTADAQTVGKAEAVVDYVIDNPITLTGLINDTPAVWEAFWV